VTSSHPVARKYRLVEWMNEQVIKSICEVRKAADLTQEMWKPLEDTVQILKRHNVDITDTHIGDFDLQSYLEEAPLIWEQVSPYMCRY